MAEIYETIAVSLFSAFAGGYLSHMFAYKFSLKSKKIDGRILSFTKLLGLKRPWLQFNRLLLESDLLCEYYDRRYFLSGQSQDREYAIKMFERKLILIEKLTAIESELFETVGKILIYNEDSKEIKDASMTLMNFNRIVLTEFPGKITTVEYLESHKNTVIERFTESISSEYEAKINRLIDCLKSVQHFSG
jgi:hypothetical protein